MKVVAGLVLLLVNVRLSHSCDGEGHILFCLTIPPAFRPGYSSLVMILKDVGDINSTVLRSDDLTSITRLRIDNAGVTGIAEGAFSSFQNLTNLSLNQNLLTWINPNWFGRPDILGQLSLTENLIEVLNESMLNKFINLTRLSLNKNRIRTIDPNSFSSQTILAELDLSENRMTRVSPQVFRSLRSTRIKLHGNPWDCSCGTEDFVDFLKDLQSRSLLDKQMEVTCESPPSLRGRPVWNVSVCVTSPPPRPPSVLTTAPASTGILTTVPASTGILTTAPASTGILTTVPASTGIPTTVPASTGILTTAPASTGILTTAPASIGILTTAPASTGILTTAPASTAKVVTTPSSRPTSETAPIIISPHTATPPARPTSGTETSVQPKPTDILTTATTPTLKTATHVTSPPSVTDISVHPQPSDLPITPSTPTGMTETCVTSRPSSGTNIVCTLIVVIVVLSSLLFVVCFLVVLHRRKRNNKTVMPENRNELKEDGSRSSHAQSPGTSEKRDFAQNNHWDSETGWRRSFTGVRAKSANAILFLSPFCAPVKDQVTLQTETEAQSKGTENQAEGKQKLGNETGIETENLTNTTDVIQKNAKQAADGRNLENLHCVSVNNDTVPYLSIGTNQNKPNPDDFNKQPSNVPGQRSQTGKVMGRISTWPPTAIQWQARCKMKEEEEEGSDVFTVWTPKFPGEVKKVLNKVERPSGSDRHKKEHEVEKNKIEDLQTAPSQDPLKMNVAHMKPGHSQSSKPNDKTTSFSEAHVHTDPATVRQTINETQDLNLEKHGQNQDLKPAENPAHKNTDKSIDKAEQRNEPKPAVMSRKRAENRSTGSKAPSGGASPDDETLLSGNEYAFMNLLHEVVQNNGRWTRERWKQIQVNKQRR